MGWQYIIINSYLTKQSIQLIMALDKTNNDKPINNAQLIQINDYKIPNQPAYVYIIALNAKSYEATPLYDWLVLKLELSLYYLEVYNMQV